MEKKDLKFYAKIHSLESFGTVDGPNIRFVIFFQGCHLQCQYCHNRDTWDMNAGKYYSVEDIFKTVMKYKNYFHPKGGVTVTGGEPLLQTKFLIELFKLLKTEGIHTCIDTSGIINITDDIKELLTLTDLVLLDIKHINEEKCKTLVGKSNKLELNFAKFLSDNNIPVWIRQVLIPGYTDSEEDLKNLKLFLNTLTNVEKVELLPYHTIGKFKWENMKIPYILDNVPDASTEDIRRAKTILNLK